MNEQAEVIGTQEAARQLGVSVRTVQLWVEKGTLKAWKTSGGHRRILRSSVDAALQKRGGTPEVKPRSGLHVLVVEDDPTVQSYYSALFDILHPNADIVMVEDGYEALIELGKACPDLLLVDVNLPQMDGITLVNKIHSSLRLEGLNIAVVTGLDAEQLAQRGELPENVPVYSKPLSIDNLSALLKVSELSADPSL